MSFELIERSDTVEIEGISDYNIIIENDTMILKLKNTSVSEISQSLTNSKIINCTIKSGRKNISSKKNAYRTILVDIWKSMALQKIIQNTSFNIQLLDSRGESGYYFNKDLNFSFQSKDSNGTWKEIIKMIKLNNYKIKAEIELADGEVINYSN